MELFYILSLERSREDTPVWWRPNKMGYTHELESAGKYSRDEAIAIYNSDVDHNDIPVLCDMVQSEEKH